MTEVMVFNNPEFGEVRTVTINNNPWFVGKDVCEILGYANPSKALSDHVDDEDKLNNKSLSSDNELNNESLSSFDLDLGQRGGWLINESGLYGLIFSSKLPSAKAFKRWVTSEVLPTIRKTGSYSVNTIVDNSVNKSEIAKFIIDCPAEKLPYILKLFDIEEIPTPIQEKPYFRYGERLDRFNTVKELMIEKGVRPAEFAKMMGYPKSTMHNYMHNYSVPSLQRCDDMIQTLNDLK